MKIRLLVARAGIGFAHVAGEKIEVSDAEGARMIAAGQAEPIRNEITAEGTIERATKPRRSERAVR